MSESPLSKVAKDSLQELFNRSPKDLSDPDVEKVCAVLREQRQGYLIEEAKPKKSKVKADLNLSLEDLDL